MKRITKFLTLAVLCVTAIPVIAQDENPDELKLAAIEALMSAPPEKALPIVAKVLSGDHSNQVKSRALFVLSQIDNAEANRILTDFASDSTNELQAEAIRMIGINGNSDALSGLREVYASGNEKTREAVMHAYMIAGDEDSVYDIAVNAQSDEEYELALHYLGAMGSVEKLRGLPSRSGSNAELIHALAIAGDSERLAELARDNSNPEMQLEAIRGLGVSGGDNVGETFLEIYRTSENQEVREAVMHGMMVAGEDDALLEMFRTTTDRAEKKELLRLLVMMDSDAAMEAIGNALDGGGL